MPVRNLLDLLSQAADAFIADSPDISIYDGNDDLVTTLSYKTLLEVSKTRAMKILTGQLVDLRQNPVVILSLENHHDTIPWFWAIVASGGIPCLLPALPEDLEQRNVQLHTLQTLLGNPWFITSFDLLNDLGGVHGLLIRTTDDIDGIYVYDFSDRTYPGISKQGEDLAVLMLTSGSTGSPKAVSLQHGQILAALAGKATIHNTTKNDVFLNFVDLHHVANLTEIHLHALYLGAQQIHVEKSSFLEDPLSFLEMIQHHRVSYTFAPNFFLSRLVSAFRSLGENQRLMMEKISKELQPIRSWRGEFGIYHMDCPQHPLNTQKFQQNPSNFELVDFSCLRALVSGGESNVIHTCDALESFLHDYNAPTGLIRPGFGMTETCAGAIYNVEDCPRYDLERKSEFTNVGVCMLGVEMRVVRRDDTEAKKGETGSLQLAGPVVFKEYYNDPEKTEASFTPDGWFKTGDLAFLDENGRLHIAGRENQTILVNGVNHHPQPIEAAIEESVSAVAPEYTAVFPHRPQDSETEALCVVFVPVYDPSDIYKRADTIAAISKAVVKFSGIRPYKIIALPEYLLPKSSLGKLSRSKIRAAFENGEYYAYIDLRDHTHQTYAPPMTSTQATILEVFNGLFNGSADYSGINTNMFLLGVSSIDILKLRMSLQKRLSIQFAVTTIFHHPVIKDFAAELDNIQLKAYNPVVILQPNGNGTPLFFIHPGVGEVLIFMNLARYITDRPVYALRARGFDNEPFFATMNEIINVYHDAIKRIQPSGPYCICGYSFGSTISFEIAKFMEFNGDEVKFLGIIDQPPHIKMRARTYDWTECVLTIAFFLDLIEEEHAYDILPTIRGSNQTCSETLDHIFEMAPPVRVQELGITKEKLDNWARLAFRLKKISGEYDPAGIVKEMDVFWANPLVGIVKAKTKVEWFGDYIAKWQDFVEEDVRFQYVGGTHRTLISPPFVKDFAGVFKEALRRREAGETGVVECEDVDSRSPLRGVRG